MDSLNVLSLASHDFALPHAPEETQKPRCLEFSFFGIGDHQHSAGTFCFTVKRTQHAEQGCWRTRSSHQWTKWLLTYGSRFDVLAVIVQSSADSAAWLLLNHNERRPPLPFFSNTQRLFSNTVLSTWRILCYGPFYVVRQDEWGMCMNDTMRTYDDQVMPFLCSELSIMVLLLHYLCWASVNRSVCGFFTTIRRFLLSEKYTIPANTFDDYLRRLLKCS